MFLGLKGTKLIIVAGVIAGLAYMLQGYDQTVANGLLTLESWVDTFPEMDTVNTKGNAKSHNSTIQGTVVAIYEIGCAIGALSCMYFGDLLGRRKVIFSACVIVIIGVILQATPFKMAQMIVARVITGLGVGALTATAPMWIAECASSKHRGKAVLLQQQFAIGGVLIATWLEFGLYYVQSNSFSWRFPIAFQSVFAIIVVATIFYMPESPRWLLKREYEDKARTNLSALRDEDSNSEAVGEEVALIQSNILLENSSDHSRNPFARTENGNLHRTILAVAICMVSQMSGVNVIAFYSTETLEAYLGYSGQISRIISGCLHIFQFLSSALSMFLIDRYGRRKLMLTSAIGMCITQACLAGVSSAEDNRGAAGAAVFFNFSAMFFFPIGLFILPSMYAAEIGPLAIRAKIAALGAATNWLFNFLIAEVTPIAQDSIGWKYYLVYACVCFAAAWSIYFFYPETKGRSLEEIDQIFVQAKSVFDVVELSYTLPFEEERLGEKEVESIHSAEV